MAASATIACELREKLGSRPSRKLRVQGRIIASIQADGEKSHLDVHFDQVEFLTSRRQHVHLYDLEVGGEAHSAVVRELQWDALGDHILHVEFKRVTRGVATQSEVNLRVYGQVKDGIPTLHHPRISISCFPSLIPDDIEVVVTDLETGARIFAKDLVLPEGVELEVDPETEVAVISGQTEQLDEPQPIGDAGAEAPGDADEGDSSESDSAPGSEGGEG
jgi:large subunit ribosomal protein L25